MSENVIEVRPEDIHDLLEEGFGRCEAIYGYRFVIGRGRLTRTFERNWPCKRPAEHVISLTCPRDGTRQIKICAMHLRMARNKRIVIRCSVCDAKATFRSGD